MNMFLCIHETCVILSCHSSESENSGEEQEREREREGDTWRL